MEINNYRNLNRIHGSGATVAFRAIRETDGTSVILKMPNTDPSAGVIARYQHEYDVLHALNGDGVVQVYDITNQRNMPVLVLEDFQAQSLASWLVDTPFNLLSRLQLAIGICTCIEAVHEQGVIHRNINPSNILINPHTLQVKLADFAVSTQFTYERQEIAAAEQLDGTLAYMSPEQTGRINRPVDTRTDLYAFGITLYEMLTGRVPFEATDPLEVIHAHIARKPPSLCENNRSIPKILSDIVLKCLAKNTEDRYQSAKGLEADLVQCLNTISGDDIAQSFPIGQHDRVLQLNVSRKLYGRETARDTIQSAFHRTAQGATEAVIISGTEGSGKSALLSECVTQWYDKNLYLGKGTFSAFHQGVPYFALGDALGQLVSRLLELPQEQMMTWRKRLQTALGTDARLLVAMIPYLEQLVGPVSGEPDINTAGAKGVLHSALSRFLCQFGNIEQPLVLCFDDLQWADEETLDFLQYLLTEGDISHILVLVTCPDQETHGTEPMMRLLTSLRSAPIMTSEIIVRFLDKGEVRALLADSFLMPPVEVSDLAEVLVTKTLGNPYFVHQMIADLYQSHYLVFDTALDCWTWDIDCVRGMDFMTNVVDHLVERLGTLSPDGQSLLMQAACIGDSFDIKWLALVREEDVQTTYAALQEATGEGFIEPVRGGAMALSGSMAPRMEGGLTFRFVHPRVRQTAYEQMPISDRKKMHLRTAQSLYTELSGEEKNRRAYELADHYLAAQDLLMSDDQAIVAAEACLNAGRTSLKMVAFEVASRYFTTGTALISANIWNESYELAFGLHFELARSEYACGHYERTLELCDFMCSHVTVTVDKLEVYGLQMYVYTTRGQIAEIQSLGREALRLCGIDVPSRINRRMVLRKYQIVKDLISNLTTEELLSLPDLSDPLLRQAQRMLTMLSNWADDNLKIFLYLHSAELSICNGVGPASWLGMFALIYLMDVRRREDLEEAVELGRVGLKIAERFAEEHAKLNSMGMFSTYLNHWSHHLKTTSDSLELYYELVSSLGLRSYALLHSFGWSFARLSCGDALAEIELQAEEFLSQSKIQGITIPVPLLGCLIETVSVLQGHGHSTLETKRVQEQPKDRFVIDDILARSLLDTMRFCLLEDNSPGPLSGTFTNLQWINERSEVVDFLIPELIFFQGLVLTSRYVEVDDLEQMKLKLCIRDRLRLLRMWADMCPDNYHHKHLLVLAEYRRLMGKRHEAADLYDEAIESAKAYGFVQNEAIANECAAKFYLAQGKERVASAYLTESRYLYERWGAHGKVHQLNDKYPHLLRSQGASDSSGTSGTGPEAPELANSTSSALDLATVLKASQAISSEIKLNQLLSTMLSLVIENAGAEKGYWILEQNEDWRITTSSTVDGHSLEIQNDSLHQTDQVSFGIVQYTIRTQEVVVLENANKEGRFVRDPYIRKAGVKSVLCFPVVNHGRTLAVLYLENNLTTGAFTTERVELLKLLSGQAAISIENARMYGDLDRLVQERTDELHRTQQQMIESEKLASLGQLTAGVAHEINNPINFVVSSTPPLRRDIDDLRKALEAYDAILENHQLTDKASKVKEELELDYVTQEIEHLLQGIEEGANRTAEIVRGLRTFSRLDEDEVKTASVTEGIESTLTLLRKQYESNIKIVREYGDVPDIECYPGKLNQVYMNLLSNAIQAINEEGEIRISVGQVDDSVRVQITDTGAGMSKEIMRRIFEPFFTTKDVGVGTGLGLSISYGIIERHRGSIEVSSELGTGTTFTITLPLRQTHA